MAEPKSIGRVNKALKIFTRGKTQKGDGGTFAPWGKTIPFSFCMQILTLVNILYNYTWELMACVRCKNLNNVAIRQNWITL